MNILTSVCDAFLMEAFKEQTIWHPQPGVLMILKPSSLLAFECQQRKTNRALVDLGIQPEVNGIGMLEFKKMDKIVEAGYLSGLEMLSRWQSQRLDRPPWDRRLKWPAFRSVIWLPATD